MTRYNPCDRMVLTSWEQRYSCTLPKDLKNFYFASDGFKLIWNYEYAGDYKRVLLKKSKMEIFQYISAQQFFKVICRAFMS